MATEVDAWSPAPQKDGECTNAAPPLFLRRDTSVQSLLELPRGLFGVLCQVHCPCMGWAAALATLSHVLVLKADTRTRNSAAEDGGSDRIVQPRCANL